MDSNGMLTFNGGVLLISEASGGANSAIDYDTDAAINGGIVIAAGSAAMAESFGSNSTQCALLYGFENVQAAGTRLTLLDEDNTVIASFAPAQAYECVEISAPAMALNSTLTLATGGNCTETDAYGLARGGTLRGAASTASITLEAVNTIAGAIQEGRFGFGHGKGGQTPQERGDRPAFPNGEMPAGGEPPALPDGAV